MTKQPPNLPTLDELAQEYRALVPFPPAFVIRLLASCWNSELVTEALAKTIAALYQFQNQINGIQPLPDGVFASSLNTFQCNLNLRDSETMKTLIEYQPPGNKCYWDCGLVPGALELPLAAKWYSGSLSPYHGILAIGVVMQGDTPDFEPAARECAAELRAVALQKDIPVISGLVAAENEQQAKEQIGQAEYWVRSLLQMMLLNHRLLRPFQ